MRNLLLLISLLTLFVLTGCGAAVVGGAAYGGYKGAREERSVGTMIDDSVIATSVKTRMITDEFVKARHIDVDVLNGIVYLIGVVESESQRRMAADIARGVDGVRGLENQLTVGSTSAGQLLEDTILTSKIRTELIKAPDIKSTNIDVDTVNNMVTLTGVVSSQAEKDAVVDVVRNVIGSRKLINNLKIGG